MTVLALCLQTAPLFPESLRVEGLFNTPLLNSLHNCRKLGGLRFRDEEIEAERVVKSNRADFQAQICLDKDAPVSSRTMLLKLCCAESQTFSGVDASLGPSQGERARVALRLPTSVLIVLYLELKHTIFVEEIVLCFLIYILLLTLLQIQMFPIPSPLHSPPPNPVLYFKKLKQKKNRRRPPAVLDHGACLRWVPLCSEEGERVEPILGVLSAQLAGFL